MNTHTTSEVEEIILEDEFEHNLTILGITGANLSFMKGWLTFYKTTLTAKHQEELESIERDLLARMAHEDYVSCPTCDETLYHLQALTPTKTDKQTDV